MTPDVLCAVDSEVPGHGELEGLRVNWEPIDTAPMDGTVVLGMSRGRVVIMKWSTLNVVAGVDTDMSRYSHDERHDEGWFAADFWRGSRLNQEACPTHWMPLPQPPAGEAKP